jgi:hypothetical protein
MKHEDHKGHEGIRAIRAASALQPGPLFGDTPLRGLFVSFVVFVV